MTALAADPSTRVDELLATYGAPDACVAELLCDRHPADAIAFTVVSADLEQRDLTYGELRELSRRFASALAAMGVRPGDRVATLMGKSVEQVVAVVGAWRLGAVHLPLFTAFAPPAIEMRLQAARARVVVTDDAQRAKLQGIAGSWQVVVAGAELDALLAGHAPYETAFVGGPDAPLISIFTSGTTGTPKAVVMPVRGLAAVQAYMELGLDATAADVYWNAADPGWAYGHYYSLTGPLCLGVRSIWLSTGFDATLTWRILTELGVTNFAAAPTVYRSLRQAIAPRDAVTLRCASSAGEPLTPDVNEWAVPALGVAVRDHYGQTETGMVVNDHQHPQLRTDGGGMGRAMPGWTTTVLAPDEDVPAQPGTPGRLAVDVPASPLCWFSGYDRDPDRSAEKFAGGGRYYLTGDTAWIGAAGDHHFVGRDDDVIVMAGYRIGPGDVESVLLRHPAIAEAAVVAAPDEVRGEVLEAFVVLAPGAEASPQLVSELQRKVKTEYAAHAFPRQVHVVDALPKTPSGKIQRFVLRQRRHDTNGANA